MAYNGKFFIQDKLDKPFKHHESFKQLWETKWKKPCEMGVYPFMFSSVKDFQPVVDKMVEADLKEPYDWDVYAQSFFPKAEELLKRASDAESKGNKDEASELYLRASSLYRISRFPAPRSEKQKYAWTEGKKACLKGLELREHPAHEVMIPHKHGVAKEPSEWPVYLMLPETATSSSPVPLLILITGLDGYRTELCVWMEGWRQNGIATLVLEIPGTGDSPAIASDPTSPDRQFSSLLDWVADQPYLNSNKTCVWGFSTGGYYAIRLAHTHHDRLAGAVSQGGGTHHMFDAEWLEASNHLEYPFDLGSTLSWKYGYDDFELFKKEARGKFSLLEDGTLDKKQCARLLLVNGTEDSIFPIDDYQVALLRGAVKEARFVDGAPHMGEPDAFFIILNWLYGVFGIKADAVAQMKTIPFKAKYD